MAMENWQLMRILSEMPPHAKLILESREGDGKYRRIFSVGSKKVVPDPNDARECGPLVENENGEWEILIT